MMNKYFEYRDFLHNQESTFDKVASISETMRLAFDKPYDYLADSVAIRGDNATELEKKLDKIALLLNKRLSKDIQVQSEPEFIIHHGVKIHGDDGSTVYTPYTLSLSDGQILTALTSNLRNSHKRFDESKPVEVDGWAINNTDITEMMEDVESVAQLSNRLATIVNRLHTVFIKKNGKNRHAELTEDIYKLKIKTNKVVWLVEDEPKPKSKPKPKPTVNILYENILRTILPTRTSMKMGIEKLINIEDEIDDMDFVLSELDKIYIEMIDNENKSR